MLLPQTFIHDICSQLWDTNHPVGSLIIRSVLHDLIDQQRKKTRNIHKVLITGLHNFLLPYPQFTQVGHIYTHSLSLHNETWMSIQGGPASNYALSQCHRQGVPLAPFYTTSLQPRTNAFSSVLHEVEMLNMRRKGDCTNTDMWIKGLSASGEGNTHTLIKTSLYILFIAYLLLSVYHC